MFAAARAELVERVIAPALAESRDVVCDRYIDSSLAYQGIARDLGLEPILQLNLHAVRDVLPDRTILVLVPPDVARERGEASDRIEREGAEFLSSVDEAYRSLAAMFPNRIVTVDGTQPPDAIAADVRGRLRDLS